MAMYNNGFPVGYQPYGGYYPQYPQQFMTAQSPQAQTVPTQQVQPMPTQPQMQIQNGGFIQVHNEMEARNYPIAPGNSVTFKDENAPYVYTKTMGFSQLDRPIFERYRLVKEEIPQETQNSYVADYSNQTTNNAAYALKSDVEALDGTYRTLREEIDAIKSAVDSIATKKPVGKPKKEENKEVDE